jgi:hypothetical protein
LLEHPGMRAKLQAMIAAGGAPATMPVPVSPVAPQAPVVPLPVPRTAQPVNDVLTAAGWFQTALAGTDARHYTKPAPEAPSPAPTRAQPIERAMPEIALDLGLDDSDEPVNPDDATQKINYDAETHKVLPPAFREILQLPDFADIVSGAIPGEANDEFVRLVKQNGARLEALEKKDSS